MNEFTGKLEKRLAIIANKIQETRRAAKDLPRIGCLSSTTDPGHLFVSIPPKPSYLKDYQKAFGSKWAQCQHVTQDNNGDTYYRFMHKKTGIPLILRVDVRDIEKEEKT